MEIKCDYCKKKFNFYGGSAHFKRSKTHYCSRHCQGVANNIKQGNRIHGMNGTKRYQIWCDVKKRAKLRGIKFELEPQDIPEIPIVCPVLGIKIKANTLSAPLDSSPSLDRINPKIGYVFGNIRIVCNRANRLRQDATLNEINLLLKDAKNIQNKIK